MEEKSAPLSSPASTPPVRPAPSGTMDPQSTEPKRHQAWRPRIDDTQRDLHGFEGKTPEADSILESPKIRDPEEDTAPLQGTKDRSDEDSLETGE